MTVFEVDFTLFNFFVTVFRFSTILLGKVVNFYRPVWFFFSDFNLLQRSYRAMDSLSLRSLTKFSLGIIFFVLLGMFVEGKFTLANVVIVCILFNC